MSTPLFKIIAAASAVTGHSREAMRNTRKDRKMVRVRWAISLIAHQNGHSLGSIGRALNRDHTTIVHACNRARDHIERGDDELVTLVSSIEKAIEHGLLVPQPAPAVSLPKPAASAKRRKARRKRPPTPPPAPKAPPPPPTLEGDTATPFSAQWWLNNDARFRQQLEKLTKTRATA